MNKFNEQKQIEETTEFQENQAMNELNNEQEITSMAHKRRVERLQNEVNQLNKPTGDGFTSDKLTLLEKSEGKWQATIHEYYAPLSDRTFSVNYKATFHNHTNGGSHQELFPLLKSAGEFLIAKVEKYYQENPNPTEQLNAEDAIDTHETEYGFFLSKRG